MESMQALAPLAQRQLHTVSVLPDGSDKFAYKCSLCSDSGWVQVELLDRPQKPVQRCLCARKADQERRLGRIPRIYRSHTLATLRPDVDRHPTQKQALEAIRASPESSFLFFGANGTGKSLFGWMLFRDAIERSAPAIGLSTAELLSELRDAEVDGTTPSVSAAELLRTRERWTIFLDEFEKARSTEFATEALFRIVDAAYSMNHRIVITSNLNPDDLEAHWQRASPQYGRSIMRRLFEIEDCTHVEMF